MPAGASSRCQHSLKKRLPSGRRQHLDRAIASGLASVLGLTDLETSKTLTAVSNARGTYNFSALAPDHYKLSTAATGFTPQLIEDLQLNPEQANAVNVQMTVAGGPTTTVTVSGTSVAELDTETAAIGGSVDSNQIKHLPSAGRDIFQLVQLAPGVFGDGSQSAGGGSNNLPGTQGPGGSGSGIFATENGPQANANGGQYESNGIAIDGISTVSAVWDGTSIITPTEDSVGSVKVVSNGYDAEEGRFSGAQVQITSKTGSNQYHGSLFFRASRPGLNAYQRFNGPTTFNPGRRPIAACCATPRVPTSTAAASAVPFCTTRSSPSSPMRPSATTRP